MTKKSEHLWKGQKLLGYTYKHVNVDCVRVRTHTAKDTRLKLSPIFTIYRLKSPKVVPKVSGHWWTLFHTVYLNIRIPWIVPANQAVQISLNDYEIFRIIYISICTIYHLWFHICFLTSLTKCWKNIKPHSSLSSISPGNPPRDDDSPLARTWYLSGLFEIIYVL